MCMVYFVELRSLVNLFFKMVFHLVLFYIKLDLRFDLLKWFQLLLIFLHNHFLLIPDRKDLTPTIIHNLVNLGVLGRCLQVSLRCCSVWRLLKWCKLLLPVQKVHSRSCFLVEITKPALINSFIRLCLLIRSLLVSKVWMVLFVLILIN